MQHKFITVFLVLLSQHCWAILIKAPDSNNLTGYQYHGPSHQYLPASQTQIEQQLPQGYDYGVAAGGTPLANYQASPIAVNTLTITPLTQYQQLPSYFVPKDISRDTQSYGNAANEKTNQFYVSRPIMESTTPKYYYGTLNNHNLNGNLDINNQGGYNYPNSKTEIFANGYRYQGTLYNKQRNRDQENSINYNDMDEFRQGFKGYEEENNNAEDKPDTPNQSNFNRENYNTQTFSHRKPEREYNSHSIGNSADVNSKAGQYWGNYNTNPQKGNSQTSGVPSNTETQLKEKPSYATENNFHPDRVEPNHNTPFSSNFYTTDRPLSWNANTYGNSFQGNVLNHTNSNFGQLHLNLPDTRFSTKSPTTRAPQFDSQNTGSNTNRYSSSQVTDSAVSQFNQKLPSTFSTQNSLPNPNGYSSSTFGSSNSAIPNGLNSYYHYQPQILDMDTKISSPQSSVANTLPQDSNNQQYYTNQNYINPSPRPLAPNQPNQSFNSATSSQVFNQYNNPSIGASQNQNYPISRPITPNQPNQFNSGISSQISNHYNNPSIGPAQTQNINPSMYQPNPSFGSEIPTLSNQNYPNENTFVTKPNLNLENNIQNPKTSENSIKFPDSSEPTKITSPQQLQFNTANKIPLYTQAIMKEPSSSNLSPISSNIVEMPSRFLELPVETKLQLPRFEQNYPGSIRGGEVSTVTPIVMAYGAPDRQPHAVYGTPLKHDENSNVLMPPSEYFEAPYARL